MANEWGDEAVNEWGDAPAQPSSQPGLLRRVAGAVAPGVFALVKGTPENIAERQAFADLTDPNKTLPQGADALNRLSVGGLTYAPMGGAAAAKAPGLLARYLDRKAVEQGRKALSGIGTPLSARKPIPEAAVREALDSGAIKPLGTVTGTAERLEKAAERVGDQYASILAELEAKGVKGPDAVALAKELAARAADAKANSLNSSRPGTLQTASQELLEKVGAAPTAPAHGHHGHGAAPAKPQGLVDPYGRPIPEAPPAPKETRLGLMQAEEIKRGLQSEAKREYDKISRQYTTAGETKKELASLVRGAIEDAVQQQSSLAPEAAASFEPVKAKLANTLGALRVAEEGAARAARRKPVSLTSTIAGSAVGAGTGSPILGILSAMGHGAVDSRLSSTLARGAHAGSKYLTQPRPSETFAAVPGQALDPFLEMLLQAMKPRLARVGADEESP